MHGREGENWKRQRRHMWSVPAPGPQAPPVVAVPSTSLSTSDSSIHSYSDSFSKHGRKIRVGDCALFQAGNSPPFIGLIRWFSTGKEDCLKLCVNWLYRPADVKLEEGILEAAPNEVFYSFHKDVISAASLLHPCKVAFLRKGVELPSGISSFVCRRAYDIAKKCLWWLTDQDYINDRQVEVDKLLDRTRLEMHAAVQTGGRSPKPLNGPTSAQQLKSGSDSVQNSGTSFPSQAKGKKRERGGDQGPEPIKRERSSKPEDGESANSKLDNMVKADIAKITEKGYLITIESVEKLVQLIQLDRSERKIDLAGRIRISEVIAATDKAECLGRFVQLRGVPVLDDWLQEAHKGKSGDGSSPKETDKGTEELLLSLLRALDKLPVNLNALQTCNIGKSVNHLRSHKNPDIQKKARSLVDTWKKRVDAEMTKINDAKSGGPNQAVTWHVKQGFPEGPHAGSRRAGSTEAAIKTSITQPAACKSIGGKPGHGDAIVKSTPATPGTLKLPSSLPSVATNSKDSPGKGAGSSGNSEVHLATVKEEKSSSSSQSQNNSQSFSSDHAKTMGSSWKEDARSSTAGSLNASKTSGGSSRHRRSSNGFMGSSVSAVHKDTNLSKAVSLTRNVAVDKVSNQSGLSSERALDMPAVDHGNSHRLIVRLPNPGRSPARSASGASLEDPSLTGSRASSPGAPDKIDHADRRIKLNGDACRSHISTDVHAESWQSNDVKEGLVGSDEGDRSPPAGLDEEHRSADETGSAADASKAACSSSGGSKGVSLVEPNTRSSFSSMNALIESCAKYSEASVPLSAGDDIGMNLLASVAAGEMSKSDLVSPSGSPGTSPKEEPCDGNNEAKSRFPCEDGVAQSRALPDEKADFDSVKQGKGASSSLASEKLHETSMHLSGESKVIIQMQGNKLTSEHKVRNTVSSVNLHEAAEYYVKPEVKSEEGRTDRCSTVGTSADVKEVAEGNGADLSAVEERKPIDHSHDKIAEGATRTTGLACNLSGDKCDNGVPATGKLEKFLAEDSSQTPSINEVARGATLAEQKQPATAENHSHAVRISNESDPASAADKVLITENTDVSKSKRSDEAEDKHLDPSDGAIKEPASIAPTTDKQAGSTAISLCNDSRVDGVSKRKEAIDKYPVSSGNEESAVPAEIATVSKMSVADVDRRGELASSAEVSAPVIASEQDNCTKLDFDLNEGLSGDDGNQTEPVPSAAPVCSPAVRLPSISPIVSTSASNGLPAPITVAAPAKGPFVPPENLLKSKAEPGWKGSAATSAFRPAEPRKILEMPLNTCDVQSSDTASVKQGRPLLDIDLNVADDRVLEDMASQSSPQTTGSESGVISNHDAPTRSAGGGLDLDLNKVDDEGADNVQFLGSTRRSRLEMPLLSVKPASGGSPNGEANMLRDFDLNNGPGLDEAGPDPLSKSQHARNPNSMPFLPPVAGLRMGNTDLGSFSSWYPPGNSYPAVAIPSFLSDRGEQPYPIVAAPGSQRTLGSVTGAGAGTFSGDVYRGAVLSSSPAMAFPQATAFPYAGFPFGSSFPLTSTFSGGSTNYIDSCPGAASCFPTSQLMGAAAGAVSSHYQRPYVVNVPEGSTSTGSESSRRWSRQCLDLNAGPVVGGDADTKDDRLPAASRQLPLASSQMFGEEQARMHQMSGGGLKRKEREGGSWEERIYKQQSWQ